MRYRPHKRFYFFNEPTQTNILIDILSIAILLAILIGIVYSINYFIG